MRAIKAILLAVLSGIVAASIVYFAVLRPKVRAWGFDPGEAELALPGDDLVPEPSAIETRGITIDAPVEKVWPWLAQMGVGRGGFYSYESMSNKIQSADEILPEFQALNGGDIMPTHATGGFLVKTARPNEALVLYTDTELVRSQAEKAKAAGIADSSDEAVMSGSQAGSSFPEFAVSWAFLLQPTDDGKTRLIERFRARTPGNGPANAVLGEIMGTGIVLMTRKQMINIKERVERVEYGLPAGELEAIEPGLAPIDELAGATTD